MHSNMAAKAKAVPNKEAASWRGARQGIEQITRQEASGSLWYTRAGTTRGVHINKRKNTCHSEWILWHPSHLQRGPIGFMLGLWVSAFEDWELRFDVQGFWPQVEAATHPLKRDVGILFSNKISPSSGFPYAAKWNLLAALTYHLTYQ